MLSDFDVQLTPHDLLTKPEKVDVLVRFAPLSTDPHQHVSAIEFGTGGMSNVGIDPAVTPTDTKVTIQKQAGGSITLGVVTTYSRLLKRLAALGDFIAQIKIPPSYVKE